MTPTEEPGSEPEIETTETPEAPEPSEPEESPEAEETEKTETTEEREESEPSETESDEDESGETESASDAEEGSEKEKPKEGKAARTIKKLKRQNQLLRQRMGAELPAGPKAEEALGTEPKLPNWETFEGTPEEFSKAAADAQTKRDEWVVKRDRQQRQVQERQQAQAKTDAEVKQKWNIQSKRVAKANPEFDTVEYLQLVQPGPIMDGFLARSNVGAEILNYLGDNLDEAEKINRMDPYDAVMALGGLQQRFSDRIKGIRISGKGGKPPPQVPGSQTGIHKEKDILDVMYDHS